MALSELLTLLATCAEEHKKNIQSSDSVSSNGGLLCFVYLNKDGSIATDKTGISVEFTLKSSPIVGEGVRARFFPQVVGVGLCRCMFVE